MKGINTIFQLKGIMYIMHYVYYGIMYVCILYKNVYYGTRIKATSV